MPGGKKGNPSKARILNNEFGTIRSLSPISLLTCLPKIEIPPRVMVHVAHARGRAGSKGARGANQKPRHNRIGVPKRVPARSTAICTTPVHKERPKPWRSHPKSEKTETTNELPRQGPSLGAARGGGKGWSTVGKPGESSKQIGK